MKISITQSYQDLLNKKKHNDYKKKTNINSEENFEAYLKNSTKQLDLMHAIKKEKPRIYLESRSFYFTSHR